MNKKIVYMLIVLLSGAQLSAMQPCTLPHCSQVDDATGIHFFVNALYWQPREEGLDYMIRNNTGATFANCATVERVNFNWNGGFRVGAGYCGRCCPIGISAYYTRFTTSGKDRISATFPSVLFPVWSNPATSIVSEQEAQAKVNLSLNMADFQLSTEFNPHCCVEIMPVLGMRYAGINQRFNINANGGQSLGPVAFVLDDAITMKNNFWGVGPKVGINSTWGDWRGLSAFGSMDFALLYGRFDITQNETITFSDNVPATTFLNIKRNRFHITRPNLGLILGMQWQWETCSGYNFCLSAGWEHQYFFGQNQLMRFSDDVNQGVNTAVQGDLSTQGLTVAISFSF